MLTIFQIRAQTIQLHKPLILDNNMVKRVVAIQDINNDRLISYENFLRKKAYKNTVIKTSDSFFDDSDMQGAYFLVVVYNIKTDIPLLSARYYFDRSAITKCLIGDEGNEHKTVVPGLNEFNEGQLFL